MPEGCSPNNLLGRSQVWIALRFYSDATQTDQGPFVDNIILRKGASGSALASQVGKGEKSGTAVARLPRP